MSTVIRSSTPRRARRASLFVVVGAVAVLAALFLELADSVRESDLVVRFDEHTLRFVLDHRFVWISNVARVVTLLGSAWVVAIVIVAAEGVLVCRRRYVDGLLVACSSIGTAILVAIAKHAIGRARPAASLRLVNAAGAAFPSGHAAQSVACYAALAVVTAFAARSSRVRWIACTAAVVVALAVGASRVYLGVHWLSDVVSGWLLASGWLAALIGVRLQLANRLRE